jgi:hypothetical protein
MGKLIRLRFPFDSPYRTVGYRFFAYGLRAPKPWASQVTLSRVTSILPTPPVTHPKVYRINLIPYGCVMFASIHAWPAAVIRQSNSYQRSLRSGRVPQRSMKASCRR